MNRYSTVMGKALECAWGVEDVRLRAMVEASCEQLELEYDRKILVA